MCNNKRGEDEGCLRKLVGVTSSSRDIQSPRIKVGKQSTVSTPPPVFTDVGEGSVLDASEGLLQGVGEPRQLHGLPQLGVLVTDRVVPHRQLGPLHRV